MDFVNVRDLKLHTGRVLNRLSRGGWAIVLRHGKPQAAIIRLTEDDIEDLVFKEPKFLRTLRAARAEYRRKGGMSLAEARRQLGV